MGLTIHWSFQGPKTKPEARAIIEKLRQRAMDLPFDAVGEIVHFEGPEAQFDREDKEEPYRWLKIMAREMICSEDRTLVWECPAKEIIGFEIDVAPGSEPMEVYLAAYPKAIQVKDERTGRPKRIRTTRSTWAGGGFCKTQYASSADCGGVPNFLRAHLSVCRMLDHAKELGIVASVSDEGEFFDNRDVPALVNTIGDWNAFIAASVGAFDDFFGGKAVAPIKGFPDFEHLEAKGQDQIDALLRFLKERGKRQ
jgi:hypothetical protein